MKTVAEVNAYAFSQAPSYYRLPDDGATFKCTDCGQRDRTQFVKFYTPEKISQVVHLECLQCGTEPNRFKDLGVYPL